ncbi:hypothetical protein K431DRAFT_227843 [Polychaeton citri CBS 116435]|uniref:ER transporter 6TM N-terminal domain-containing protein n=1 Tax=Polychaeton citri CBS 116435 TaxID=1314669 RepID=A0A9P4Q4R0_9PEZI|nr:hypothetical protein K431DRAFT_227843 [Polychaeton citri CBS 116435]
MFKGALAPTIAIASFQAHRWADFFVTIGFLIAVATVISVVIMPRAKFIQNIFFNILFICVGSLVTLLALYCTIQARHNTETYPGNGPTSGVVTEGVQTVQYNSSASVVAAIWLVVQLFIISALRAARPQFTVPGICWAIFANVGMVYAPQFADMTAAEDFLRRLLIAFIVGFAIGTGVSLLIFPLTTRGIVFKTTVSYANALIEVLHANIDYMRSLEQADMFTTKRLNTAGESLSSSLEADAVKSKAKAIGAIHSKLAADIPFAKREIALGKLGPDDIQQIFKQLRLIMIPTVGLGQLSEIFHNIAENRGWGSVVDRSGSVVDGHDEKLRAQTVQEYHDLMCAVREPFARVSHVTEKGIQHALIQLQLIPKPTKVDEENRGDEPEPGDQNFALFLNKNLFDFKKSKIELLKRWAEVHDIQLEEDFFDNPATARFSGPDWMEKDFTSDEQTRYRRQLYICLYMEFLLWAVASRVLEFVNFADELKASGKLDKTRLIFPGRKRLRKWVTNAFRNVEDSQEDEHGGVCDNNMNVYLGEAFRRKRDPAHLPPETRWEHGSDKLRAIAHFFASPPAAFAFRVCCATMSIYVVNCLRETQVFYTRERIFWAQIMITIGMQPSAGQSLRNFIFRIGGTAVAMVFSLVAWYIVDGHAAGVIVFMWLFLHVPVYIQLKKPQWMTLGMVGQITMVIVIGYELEVQQLGEAAATTNGQAFYPPYILGPLRLATVIGGLFLAWIWTVFPYPISEHMQIQQKLGASLYLLANFYSIMHETVQVRLRGAEGDMSSKESPGRKLEKVRIKVFSKATMLLQGLRAQTAFVKYDLPIGGKFPQAQYNQLLDDLSSVMNCMQLISYASAVFTDMRTLATQDSEGEWLYTFQRLIKDAGVTSQAITTLLTLLSSSVNSGQPLPPYIRIPEPYLLSQRLDELDHDLLSVRHIAEPGYASFAVIQIATRSLIDDLKRLLEGIKELVGELDFSYHIVSTSDQSHNQSEETLTYTPSSSSSYKKKPE